jgi:hypothetical protein
MALFLVRPTRIGDGAINNWSNLLGIFPRRARRVVCRARLPFGCGFDELGAGQFYVKWVNVRALCDFTADTPAG